VPCIGAALIIAAGRSGPSVIGQTLSFSPLVFVGMISYSLYLWHWPIIVFQGIGGLLIPGVPPRLAKLAALVVSFVIATLSWRFVEQPFRGRGFRISRPAIVRLAAASAATLLALGASALLTNGWPSRFPAEAVKVASFLETSDASTQAQYRVGSCFLTSRDTYAQFDAAECLRRDVHKKNYLLIGDSHAAQLWYGLASVFSEVNIMQATASGCKPTLEQNVGADEKCLQLMHYMFAEYLPKHRVATLLIAARWDHRDLQRLPPMIHAVRQQAGEIVLFGPIVQYDSALPRLLALAIKKNDPDIPAYHRIGSYESLDADMAQAAAQLGVRYISYYKLLCEHQNCREYAEQGIPLQADYGHLTGSGSVFMATTIRERGELP
jgi:SGNH domain (fused to AT3 domains)